MVDKANVLETSRLWRRVVKTVSESYRMYFNFLFVNNAAMQHHIESRQFDVI
jgi:3-isopropylmalate dehydrogenase